MNHTKWVAWGVVDVEALDKQQRRVYLKKIRNELAERGCILHPGGSTQVPWYRVEMAGPAGPKTKHETKAGADALKHVLAWTLEQLGEVQGAENVSSPDGGVRCAGDEAQEPA